MDNRVAKILGHFFSIPEAGPGGPQMTLIISILDVVSGLRTVNLVYRISDVWRVNGSVDDQSQGHDQCHYGI